MLRSSCILNERNLSCKIVKNCIIIGLNRARKNKFCSRSVCKNRHTGIALFFSDLMYKNIDIKYVSKPGLHTTRFVAKIY